MQVKRFEAEIPVAVQLRVVGGSDYVPAFDVYYAGRQLGSVYFNEGRGFWEAKAIGSSSVWDVAPDSRLTDKTCKQAALRGAAVLVELIMDRG